MCFCLLYHLWLFLRFARKLWHKGKPTKMDSNCHSSQTDLVTLYKNDTVFERGLKSETAEYHTFRIPAIVSHGDWILAFCEGRIQTSADHGAIDIILRRAKVTNGKPEWDKNVIVVVPSGQGYRSMNPCPVVDKDGNILLVYARFPIDKLERDLIVGDKYEQKVFCCKSSNNGESWDEPNEITNVLDILQTDLLLYAPGPGHGILTEKDRIVVSGNLQYNRALTSRWQKRLKKLFPFYRSEGKTCIIYSDDGGKEWHGRVIDSATYNPSPCKRACMRLFRRKYTRHVHANESQVAELPGGKLFINSRTKELTKNRQSVITDKDGIAIDTVLTDLTEPSGTYRWLAHCIPDFIRCGGCEGSVLSINHEGDKLLIFSNPAHKRKRENMSIRISRDEGKQWSEPLTLYSGPASYSDLVSVTISNNEGRNVETLIGCLYECGDRGQYEASRIVLSLFDVAQLKKLTFKKGMKSTMNDRTPLVKKQIP
ncbi:sialidase-3-like isoform X2 [Apostichopus japonicus]|uniref:sialidase-3-like isoform X2 n=1 Tax=Stichopus japonicus TaxID=307972 RepID=UPI003AB2C510